MNSNNTPAFEPWSYQEVEEERQRQLEELELQNSSN
jgi:hypothetical protein|tara:strand:+ start:16391 stop:16498 length:108 start_codon:yes stop_codon:yes gene_type:complete